MTNDRKEVMEFRAKHNPLQSEAIAAIAAQVNAARHFYDDTHRYTSLRFTLLGVGRVENGDVVARYLTTPVDRKTLV